MSVSCAICGRVFTARRGASIHRLRRHGTWVARPPRLRDPVERWIELVDASGDCWLWTGTIDQDGYGRFGIGGTHVGAHRWAYEQFVGPIPRTFHVDHRCRVRRCVNPDHLEAVTLAENNRRSPTWAGRNVRKTRCVHGHPLAGDNLYLRADGTRACLTCRRATSRRWYAQRSVA